MTLTRRQTVALLIIAAVFFSFTLLQASWLANNPSGKPKLIADHGVDPVRDTTGCVASANAGYGTVAVGHDVSSLQGAVGAKADAVWITTETVGGELVLAQQFDSNCPADKTRARATISQAAAGLTKPELFWQIKGADQAAMLLAQLPPAAVGRSILVGDEAAVAAIKQSRLKAWAFSVASARECASDYKTSGIWGNVPASCHDGTILLTLDDLGYTLWGWPNRFLARMEAANVHVIIVQDVVGGQIKGLTDVDQYGEIADSFNGYIWVDNIADLGPALKR